MCASTPACAQGDTVTPFYDPMIAKVIVHDRDRASAMRRMAALMGETEVVGVTTNAALLKALCSHPAFVGGEVDTGFIERHRDELFAKPAPADDRAFAVATLARLVEWQERGAGDSAILIAVGPEERLPPARRGPRRGALEGRRARGRGDRAPPSRRRRSAWSCRRHASRPACSAPTTAGWRSAWATTPSRPPSCAAPRPTAASTTRCSPTAAAGACAWSIRSTSRNTRRSASAEAPVRSPLPGKIIDLRVKAGDTVSKGQPLLVLEAMKMEHTLAAPADGKVKSVRYAVGEQVPEGAELVEFEDELSDGGSCHGQVHRRAALPPAGVGGRGEGLFPRRGARLRVPRADPLDRRPAPQQGRARAPSRASSRAARPT